MAGQRDKRIWVYASIGIGGGLALLLLPLLVIGPARPHAIVEINPVRVLAFTAAAAAIGWVFAFTWLVFRQSDEFTREGSKFAWYWGGLIGIAASVPLYVFIALGGLHWLDSASPVGRELARAFVTGYCVLLFPQVAGVLAVSAWWWLAKR